MKPILAAVSFCLLAGIDWPTIIAYVVMGSAGCVALWGFSGALYDAWDLWKGEDDEA